MVLMNENYKYSEIRNVWSSWILYCKQLTMLTLVLFLASLFSPADLFVYKYHMFSIPEALKKNVEAR